MRKNSVKRVILVLILIILIMITSVIGITYYEISPKDKNGVEVEFVVNNGEVVNQVFERLESDGIIKSALFMKIYSKMVGGLEVQAGTYKISASMNIMTIHSILSGNSISNKETFTMTFKEGENVRDLISLITSNTNITKEEILNKLSDNDYLDSLISKYWFLSEEIKNEDIYYSLEGYLFPNTYEFYKDATLEDILGKMLDETNKQLEKYRSDIESSEYSVHKLLTLASIVELESNNIEDRANIAGVFTNRLRDGWALESCVSTFYAFNINMGERDLKMSEITDCSTKYNTRCSSFKGLPVGPIGNAGIVSIEATLHPANHDYYFFASDKNMKTYFSKTNSEHESTVAKLKREGLWLEY